jgi:hypothetical protein
VNEMTSRCAGAALIVLGVACATVQLPGTRIARSPAAECSISADRVSRRVEGDAEIFAYAGQAVVTCPGQRPSVYSNLTITRHKGGAVEMTADSVELR